MRPAPDQLQARALAQHLRSLGARLGASHVTFNAHQIAQREAAQGRDLSQRAVFGRRVVAAPDAHAANDHFPVPSEQPAPPFA